MQTSDVIINIILYLWLFQQTCWILVILFEIQLKFMIFMIDKCNFSWHHIIGSFHLDCRGKHRSHSLWSLRGQVYLELVSNLIWSWYRVARKDNFVVTRLNRNKQYLVCRLSRIFKTYFTLIIRDFVIFPLYTFIMLNNMKIKIYVLRYIYIREDFCIEWNTVLKHLLRFT